MEDPINLKLVLSTYGKKQNKYVRHKTLCKFICTACILWT